MVLYSVGPGRTTVDHSAIPSTTIWSEEGQFRQKIDAVMFIFFLIIKTFFFNSEKNGHSLQLLLGT
jgi:hypothetical protein